MNHDKMDSDEDIFHDAFRIFRDVEIPSGLKAKCVISAEAGFAGATPEDSFGLAKKNDQSLRLPFAIAASLLIGVGVGWVLRGQRHGVTEHVQNNAKTQGNFVLPAGRVNATSVVEYVEESDERSFRIEETYLCGVGRIESRTNYRLTGDQK